MNGNKRVLVIEDFEVIQRLVEVILTASGLDVTTCSDGVGGLERLLDDAPDLLVLDIALPRMSGWEILDHLATLPTRSYPILVLTAHATEGDRRRAYEAGVDAFMAKPFRPDDLRRTVTRLLGSPPATTDPAAPVATAGPNR